MKYYFSKWTLGTLSVHRMVLYIFIVLSLLPPRAYQKVMIVIFKSHCSLSAWPAIFFHQPKLIVRFFDTHSVEWGCKFKLVMPLFMITCGQYLWGTRTGIDRKPEFRLNFFSTTVRERLWIICNNRFIKIQNCCFYYLGFFKSYLLDLHLWYF